MDDFTLIGVCGLYCGACPHYRASFDEGKHLLEKARREGRKIEGYACKGCRSDTLYVNSSCKDCEIRACAGDRGILHCGLCERFPCSRLVEFRDDGHIHHLDIMEKLEDVKTKGPERWLKEKEKQWRCPECGGAYSWYETACFECGTELDAYGDKEIM